MVMRTWIEAVLLYETLLAAALVGGCWTPSKAGVLEGLWLEVSGTYASVESQLDEHLRALGVELPVTAIDHTVGAEAALHQELSRGFGVFLRSGYSRGSATANTRDFRSRGHNQERR